MSVPLLDLGGQSYVPVSLARRSWATRLLTSGERTIRDPADYAAALKAFEQESREKGAPKEAELNY